MKKDYFIGLGAFLMIILYCVFVAVLFVVSWFIGGYISSYYLHFSGWLWWGSTLLVMMVIWGLLGVGSNQVRTQNQ